MGLAPEWTFTCICKSPEKILLRAWSGCTVSHQCELLNGSANYLTMQMISNTGSGCRVSHQCELLDIPLSCQTGQMVCTLGATEQFLTSVTPKCVFKSPDGAKVFLHWEQLYGFSPVRPLIWYRKKKKVDYVCCIWSQHIWWTRTYSRHPWNNI